MIAKIIKLTLPLLLTLSSVTMADPLWIDVRTAEEFASGHVEGSVNIPYENIVAKIGDLTTDKGADIRVYCQSGRRSGIAKEMLEKQGFTNVTNEGGYQDLMKKK